MSTIDDVMPKILAAAAQSIPRHAQSSGMDVRSMPEYLMPAFALYEVGSEITITLETSMRWLSDWNTEARLRRGLVRLPEEEAALAAIAVEIGAPRVDMVIFDGGNTCSKEKQDFLALVEWKKWWPSEEDRDKLLRILRYVDTCPYGAICFFVEEHHANFLSTEAGRVGDRWYQVPVPALPPEVSDTNYALCARIFARREEMN
jgi:hypothetical protein